MIKVVAGGEITSQDWTEAADRFLPASAPGSQASGQFTVGFLNASKVYELNVVTHKSGETQVQVSESIKSFISPQIGVSISGGKIYGETFDEIGTRAFGGYSTQIFGGASLGNWGVTGDGWMGVDSPNLKDINPRKDIREGVYGWDVGVGYGWSTTLSGGVAVLEAEPLSEKVRRLFGRKFGDFVEEITHIEKEEVKGPWLLACRAMRGCGR